MSTITSKVSVQMAAEVYAVQNDLRLKLFLMRPEFSNQKQVLKAEVGSRLINTKDGFGAH